MRKLFKETLQFNVRTLISEQLFLNSSHNSVQSLSHVWLFATPWTTACQASLSITNHQSLLKLMSIESVRPSNHLILFCPLFLLLSIFPSIRIFSNESVLPIRWPKYWGFCFNISPSNDYSGLISFTINWLDLLAVQGTLKSLLQHHSSKASVLQRSAFFIVQLSHPYMTTGKTIALTSQTFVSKVMSLPFKMLSKMEKEMATHSSTLAWEIPCTEEPGRLQSMGSQRVRHDWETTHSSWSQLFFQGAKLAAVTICSDSGVPKK